MNTSTIQLVALIGAITLIMMVVVAVSLGALNEGNLKGIIDLLGLFFNFIKNNFSSSATSGLLSASIFFSEKERTFRLYRWVVLQFWKVWGAFSPHRTTAEWQIVENEVKRFITELQCAGYSDSDIRLLVRTAFRDRTKSSSQLHIIDEIMLLHNLRAGGAA